MIQKSIKMTSKGTFTLPVGVRRHLELNAPGDKLLLTFHPGSRIIELQKAPDFAALRDKLRPLAQQTKSFDIDVTRQKRRDDSAREYLS